jgi:hypothetical protein
MATPVNEDGRLGEKVLGEGMGIIPECAAALPECDRYKKGDFAPEFVRLTSLGHYFLIGGVKLLIWRYVSACAVES